MNNLKIGDKVKFFLDSYWPGEGIIVEAGSSNCHVVKLTKNCKEFVVGKRILVYPEFDNICLND